MRRAHESIEYVACARRIATRLTWQHFGLKMPERAAANLPLFGENG